MELYLKKVNKMNNKAEKFNARVKLLQKRIERGVNWLNKNVGVTWHQRVKMKKFDVSKATTCIVGQVFGNYWDVIRGYSGINLDSPKCLSLGFQLEGINSNDEYDLLHSLWVKKLRELKRRK